MSNTEGANTHCIRRKKWNPRDPPTGAVMSQAKHSSSP